MNDIDQFYQILKENPSELIEENLLANKSEKIYDKWTGVVIDNNDTHAFDKKLGRIQIRINGYYDNISDANLPWAMPEIGFIGSTIGNFIVPEIGSIVRGYFEQGDIQRPIYDSLAPAADNIKRSKAAALLGASDDYPFKMVLLETDNGDFLTLNKKTGELLFTHRTGSQFAINSKGDIKIKANVASTTDTDNLIGDVRCAVNVEAEGNINLIANNQITINGAAGVNINTELDSVGEVILGNNPMPQLVNNMKVCPILGCPLAVGNTKVKC